MDVNLKLSGCHLFFLQLSCYVPSKKYIYIYLKLLQSEVSYQSDKL